MVERGDSVSSDLEHCTTLLTHYHHRLDTDSLEFLRGSVKPRLLRGQALTPRQREWFDALVTRHLGDTGSTVSEEDLWK